MILGLAEGDALPLNIMAALACFLSDIGKERPGPAKTLAGRALRAFDVSLAIKDSPKAGN